MLNQSQVPDASVTVPDISASLPEVSGDVSAPSAGGIDFDVTVPSVGVDASAPTGSVDLPGEWKAAGFARFLLCLFWSRGSYPWVVDAVHQAYVG